MRKKRRNKQKSKSKIKHRRVKVPEDAFEPKNVKARITMWVGMDVLEEIRRRAAAKDLPYQTYMNQILRETVLGSSEDERIRKLIREELAKKIG